jgi:putative CocE/NonD family hydrolase
VPADSDIHVYRDVMIPMRDGVRLAADVYRPADAGPLPAAVVRTAYGKSRPELGFDYARIAAAGFAVVVQDKRGRYGSEGEYRVLRDDGIGTHQDGYDTVEWVARQPWCTGDVGAFGVSYLGQTVLGAAVAAPPHLRAGTPAQPSSDEFTDRSFLDGVLISGMGTWAAIPLVADDLIAKLPEGRRDEAAAELGKYLAGLPAVAASTPPLDQPFLRLFPQLWAEPLLHREEPGFFAESRFDREEAERVTVPLLHLGGWFDFFTRNSVRQYCLLTEHAATSDARAGQRLVLGPWAHGGFSTDEVHGVDFPGAAVDYVGLVAEWLGRWLRGDPPRNPDHRVIVYVVGPNRWRAETAWPLPGAVMTGFGLAADGRAVPGDPAEGVRTFRYDPADPYLAGRLPEVGMADLSAFHGDNVLTFDTEPAADETEVTGTPEAFLHMSTTTTDADWVVELHQVSADGTPRLVNEGVARARYRRSRTKPEPVQPGAIEEYRVELRPMSAVIPRGGRLRVVVTAGKYPAFERNPQAFTDMNAVTDSDLRPADHTLHSGPGRSRIIVPLIDPGRRGEWIDNPWPCQPPAGLTPFTEYPAGSLRTDQDI